MNEWRAVGIVARREIRERVRSRAFLGTLVVTVALVLAVLLLPVIFGGSSDGGVTIGLVADPGGVRPALERASDGAGVDLEVLDVDDGDAAAIFALTEGGADVVVAADRSILVEEELSGDAALVVGAALGELELTDRVEGLDPAERAALLAPSEPPVIRALDPLDDDESERQVIAFAVTIALFFAVNLFGGAILNGVLEEKTSRVVELVLAAVPARVVLAGKILGLGTLALAQLALLGAVALGVTAVVDDVSLPSTGAATIAAGLVWFVLGFALYAVLFAVAGSLASRPEDAQAAATPVSLVVVVGYLVTVLSIGSGTDSPVATAVTLFPLTSPMAVPARVAQGAIAPWELIASTVLLAGSAAVGVALGGHMYRSTVLRTGTRIGWVEAFHRRRDTEDRRGARREPADRHGLRGRRSPRAARPCRR